MHTAKMYSLKAFHVDIADEYPMEIETEEQSLQLIIVRPQGEWRVTPVFLFIPGVTVPENDYAAHRRLVCALVMMTGFTAVYVERNNMSTAGNEPFCKKQLHAAVNWVAKCGDQIRVDGEKLGIVGNDVCRIDDASSELTAIESSVTAFNEPFLSQGAAKIRIGNPGPQQLIETATMLKQYLQ